MNEMRIPKSKKIKKWLSILIIAALVIPLCISFPAGASSLKEEVVYVKLNNDGSVDKVYVVNSFQLDEDGDILDYGNYEYVKNLSGSETLRLESGRVTMGTKVDKLQYEGFLMDPQLPWEISIKYILDGNEISPDDLAGKTGYLDIVIETKRNPKGSEEFFDSYALQIAMTLKGDLTKNITAEDGTLATAGNDKQINFIVLPGKEASLQLSADVTKFEMPSVTIAGVRLNMDFDFDDVDMSEIRELIDGIAELDDGVIELLDGVFELKDGTRELKDGVGDLKEGTGEMVDGAIELTDGSDELVDGTRDFYEGVIEFSDGIDQLYDGIAELTDGMKQLNDGIAEIDDGIASASSGGNMLYQGFSQFFDEAIFPMVNSQLASIPTSGPAITITKNNYQAVIEEVVFGSAVQAARAQISNQVYAGAREGVLLGILSEIGKTEAEYESLPDDVKIGIDMAVQEQLDSITPELEIQIDQILEQKMGEIIADVKAVPQAKQLLGLIEMLKGYDQLLSGLSSYTGGISRLKRGVHQYRDGIGEYYSGMKRFHRESEELVDGAHELKSGTNDLLDGIIEFRDGIVEFKDGVIELHDGVIELFDGIVELHDGVVELYDGVVELRDGTKELREETATLDTDIIDGIKEKFDELMGKGMPTHSFTSDKNGEITAVQFVMRTEGISIPKVETVLPEPEKTTLWNKLLKLFGL